LRCSGISDEADMVASLRIWGIGAAIQFSRELTGRDADRAVLGAGVEGLREPDVEGADCGALAS